MVHSMLRPSTKLLLCALCFVILVGCNPAKPFYLNDYGDLSYYIDQQIETRYPDVDTVTIEETANAHAPLTVADESITNFVDLSLEDAVSIALQNSKVLRGYGTPGLQNNLVAPGVDSLSNGPAGAGTIYDVAIRESEPGSLTQPGQATTPSLLNTNTGLDSNQGVESALAEFDAHFTTSAFWNKTDRPQNFVFPGFGVRQFQESTGNVIAELSKKTAEGTQLFMRSNTEYRRNNNPLIGQGGAQALSSIYTQLLELEARQPLLRGRGAFINRMPVIFARIGSDQQLAQTEAQLHNMLCNVEIRYWNLHCAYRNFEAAKEGRDSALEVFNLEKDKFEIGSSEKGRGGTRQTVAQSQEQYFYFRSEVERRYAEMLNAETDLRWLLGWATTDGRFIRPTDNPVTARVDFDWCQVLTEGVSLRPQLRQERWELKKRELAVAYAKNGLLPQLDAVGQYGFVGLGDELGLGSRNGLNFPAQGSGAWDELFGGNYQEYRLGFTFGMPIGYRRELANVRNAQLKVAREVARLEDMELDTARELAQCYRALRTNYQLAESHYNRWTSAETEVASFEDLREAGQATVDLALDAQRRRVQSKVAYYDSICEYNKNIALMHLRKGTILQYNTVQFGEGPWPSKAYDDAMEHARRRGASREVNYGWTRPGVVSDESLNFSHNGSGYGGYESNEVYSDGMIYSDSVPVESLPTYPLNSNMGPSSMQGNPMQKTPTPAAPRELPRIVPEVIDAPMPTDQSRNAIPDNNFRTASNAGPAVAVRSIGDASPAADSQSQSGLSQSSQALNSQPLQKSRAIIRAVNYQE
jgi:outer membrane protein TolC